MIGSICDNSCWKLVPDAVRRGSGKGVLAGPVDHILRIFGNPSSMAITR